MRTTLRSLILLPTLLCPVLAFAQADYRLTAQGKDISFQQLAERAAKARLVYVGEQHGTKAHHQLQADILASLAGKGPVALGCEYFPKSLQPILDKFNKKQITLAEFPKAIDWPKTWGFPYSAYEPIFRACYENNIAVYALNAPRAQVRKVRMRGLKALPLDELLAMPRMDLKAPAHRKRLFAQLQKVHPMPKKMLERFYQAFTLWDETMADSTLGIFLKDRRPNLRVVVIAGRAHIETGTGIPDRVSRRLPLPRLVVVCGKAPDDYGDVILQPPPKVRAVSVDMRLLPTQRALVGEAKLTVDGKGPLGLLLNKRFVVKTVKDGEGNLLPFKASVTNTGQQRVRVDARAKLIVRYATRFAPLAGSRHMLARRLSAYVGPEGAYLSGGAGWYPRAEDGAQVPTTVKVHGSNFESVCEGRRLSRTQRGDKVETTWQADKPFEPLTLVAGPYKVVERDHKGTALYGYFYPSEAHLADGYLKAVAGYLDHYTKELGPYPFAKFAVVEHFLPTGYGFPSFTLLGKHVVRLPFIVNTSLRHEVVHCWWGNGVLVGRGGNWCEALTSYCSDYQRATEGGAAEAKRYRWNVLADYAAYAHTGREIPLSRFRSRHDGATRAIGYGKGMMVFHALRRRVGDVVWNKGLRRMVHKQMGKETGYRYMRFLFGIYAKQGLGWFFKQWVERPGAPKLVLDGAMLADGKVKVRLRATDGKSWRLKLPIGLDLGDGVPWIKTVDVTLSATSKVVTLDLPGEIKRARVVIDPEFQVFRRLHPSELPIGIRRVLGAKTRTIVLPPASDPNYAAYRALANRLARRVQARVVSATQGGSLKGGQILLGSGSNAGRQVRRMLEGMSSRRFVFGPNGYTIGSRSVSGPGALAIACVPTRDGGVAVLVDGRSATGIAAGYKLVHYGRYSELLFDRGRARVRIRPQPPRAGPLSAVVR